MQQPVPMISIFMICAKSVADTGTRTWRVRAQYRYHLHRQPWSAIDLHARKRGCRRYFQVFRRQNRQGRKRTANDGEKRENHHGKRATASVDATARAARNAVRKDDHHDARSKTDICIPLGQLTFTADQIAPWKIQEWQHPPRQMSKHCSVLR